MLLRLALILVAALAGQAAAANLKIVANANYDQPNFDKVFEFVPNEITARVGDVLEFHFAGPGKGVLGGNHSVAQGVFGKPCQPAPNGFWSGYMPVNATSSEADNVFLVRIDTTDPLVFYCTQGTHCTRGMYGVVNANGSQNMKSYKSGINRDFNAGVPQRAASGGVMSPNDISNIIPDKTSGASGSLKASLAGVAAVVYLFMVMA